MIIGLSFKISTADVNLQSQLPNEARYINDKFIIMVTDDIPTLKLSGNQSCGIETAISSITELCRDFEVVDIEPFYDGVLSNPSLITGMSKIYIVTISDEDQLFNAISAFSEDSNIEFAELYALPQPMYGPDDPYLSNGIFTIPNWSRLGISSGEIQPDTQ